MADFGGTLFSYRYRNNIEAVWPAINIVRKKKITRGLYHFVYFRLVDYRLRRRKFLIKPGLDLHKHNRPVAIDHNKVDFARLAGVIASERFKSFSFEKFLALPLPPFTESKPILEQLVSFK